MPYDENGASPLETVPNELAEELYARHVEVQTLADLMGSDMQRGTAIPALYNLWYKFIQNPSTVSVETAKRMIDTDDTIGSGVDFLTSCLCARLGAYQHPSAEITRFINQALEDTEGGFYNTFKDILSACWAGFSVSEIVWANKAIGFVPDRIVTMPPSSILFEVDRLGRITDDGILQYQRNYNPIGIANGLGFFSGVATNGFVPNRPDPAAKFGDLPFPLRSANTFSYMSIRIPKIKCIHFSWKSQGNFGNPYGRMLLRRAYNWWVQKWAYTQMMGVALDRKGTPLTVVYADANATMVKASAYTSSEKAKRSDAQRAPDAAREAFQNVHNDTVIVLPGKKGQIFDVDPIEQASNTTDFLAAIQHCDRGELRALLIPSLVFTNGDGTGSYALGQEHAKTFDKVCDGYLEGGKRTVIEQLIKQMICYNFPRSAWEKKGFGGFAKRELTQDERQKEAEMFEKAVNMGVVDVNEIGDLNKMREAMGFEPRDTPIKKPTPPAFGNPFGDDDGENVEPDGSEGSAEREAGQGDDRGPLQPGRGPGGDRREGGRAGATGAEETDPG